MSGSEGKSNYKVSTLGDYYKLGFDLDTPDDDFLFLFHEGERIAVFSQTGATTDSIRVRCSSHLLVNHSRAVYEAAPLDANRPVP